MYFHFMCATHHCEDLQPEDSESVTVTLPKGHIIASIHTAILKYNHLPLTTQRCHIFPQLYAKF